MTWLLLALHILLISAFGLRILLRDDLRPDVRMGWLLVMVLLPYASCLLYYLFGEAALGRGRSRKRLNTHAYLLAHAPASQLQQLQLGNTPQAAAASMGAARQAIAPRWQSAFAYAASVNGFVPQGGHQAELLADGAQARARMLQDMDAAQQEILVLYYIWLPDETGTAMAQALMRAAQRGVRCRAMVDGLGSRSLLRSPLWQQMGAAGVELAVALPVHRPLHVMLTSRIDLRNHRKITIIDRHTTYCGSQNCADEAFHIKPRYAPWVDIMLRMQGPLVLQLQWVFASDWGQSDAKPFVPQAFVPQTFEPPTPAPQPQAPEDGAPGPAEGFVAVAIADGPTERPRSTPQLVATLLASAQREVVISTPYFVPDATVLEALCTTAWRGVQVSLILPARNDSWIVGAASRSSYRRLLQAGVQLYEYRPGLLHAKTLCVDGELSLLGSTNLDLRSFDLNFENNVLLQDRTLTQAIRARQQDYIRDSFAVTATQVRAWPWWRRIWHNLLAMLSPVL
ncbi:MAG: cardiolipin synthase [Acidovorax sp.]|nr:cardiolipin synthase [Acidovorax sp.]